MSKYPDQPPPYGFQQPQQSGPPAMSAQVVTVVHTTTAVGPNSQVITCPSCRRQVSTKIESEAATKTHLMAILLCVFMCWPCVCVPYCMDSCKNLNHYCPSCNAFIGTYNA